LSPKRKRFQHQDGKTLRCAIDRSRQAGRTRSNDDHVVRLAPEARRYQAQSPGQIVLRRIPEHCGVRQDNDRELARIRGDAREQRRSIPVLIWIDDAERNCVAFEEVRQPCHVWGLKCPDDHRASEAELDQRYSTQDESAQDALAELGLGDEQCPQGLRQNNDGLHVTDGSGVEGAQIRSAGELTDLSNDFSRDHLHHFFDRCTNQLCER
jgi:hypothetical protein